MTSLGVGGPGEKPFIVIEQIHRKKKAQPNYFFVKLSFPVHNCICWSS